MERKEMHFTVQGLTALKAPTTGRVYAWDDKAPKLTLCVTPTGAKVFYVYRWMNGRPQRVRIGRFPEVTIEQARHRATQIAAEIGRGLDPAEERRKLRSQPTLDDLFKYYLEQHAKVHKRVRSWQDDEKQYKRYLGDWKTRRLTTIHQSDIKTLHAKIGSDHGHYAANRLLSLLHKMFNEAAGMGFTAANPAHGVRKYREESRERFLQPDELRRFIAALESEPDANMADLFWLLLLTGARKGNMCAMGWVHIDLDAAVWTIPPSAAKAGYAITIPLTSKAVEILQHRKAANLKSSEYVFPSYGRTGHITEAKSAWKALLKRAGIADLRLHDLRRTMGSWQAATGASLITIGKSLGHRNVSTTAVYARLNIDPVRASVNKATDAMLAAGGVAPVAVAKADQVG